MIIIHILVEVGSGGQLINLLLSVCVVIAPLAGDQTCFKPRPELKCSYFWPELEPTRLRVGKSTAAGEWCLKTVPTVELSPHTDSRQGSTTDQGDVYV